MCMQASEAALESVQEDVLDRGRQLSEATADLQRGVSSSCHHVTSRIVWVTALDAIIGAVERIVGVKWSGLRPLSGIERIAMWAKPEVALHALQHARGLRGRSRGWRAHVRAHRHSARTRRDRHTTCAAACWP